jgi:hypothetical protein
MAYQLHHIYTKEIPAAEELEKLSNAQLDSMTKSLQDDIALIQEETLAMTNYWQAHRDASTVAAANGGGGAGGGGAGGDGFGDAPGYGMMPSDNMASMGDVDDGMGVAAAMAAVTTGGGGGGRRKGKAYRRKSEEHRALILTVDDKMTVVGEEHERVKAETQAAKDASLESRELMYATLSEAEARIDELALAQTYFNRDVVAGDPAGAAERLAAYIADRPAQCDRQLRNLKRKAAMVQLQLNKLEQQLDSAGDQGDKFFRIDFDQLKIENQQYSERLADKEKELKQLKTTTTRTVQTLNALTDRLSQLLAQQGDATRDLQMRREHCKKLEKELGEVQGGGAAARARNVSLKIQHESVKVPKVEEYIAQKAEEYELRKAVGNWRRKVEIARGHVHVLKQKSREAKRQTAAAAEARAALMLPGGGGNVRATIAGLRGTFGAGGGGGGGGGAAAAASAGPSPAPMAASGSALGAAPAAAAVPGSATASVPRGSGRSGRSVTSGIEAIPAPPPAAASSGIRNPRPRPT